MQGARNPSVGAIHELPLHGCTPQLAFPVLDTGKAEPARRNQVQAGGTPQMGVFHQPAKQTFCRT
jgi:hypothetical protein